ncbi:MAG: dTMP kinase [Planctomycetota bacterium]|jgi:dTMP kinase
MLQGKLIVVDGIDGSGKATQTKLLIERLQGEGVRVMTLDFPQYYDNFFGKLIGECLKGAYGDFIGIHPKIVSVLYAADRWESSKKIQGWLDDGYTVVLDRYVSANQIHQAGKIMDEEERKDFLQWLATMEYEIMSIPKPDLTVYLDVPIETVEKLLVGKEESYGKDGEDQAEKDFIHQEYSRQSAMGMANTKEDWVMISCVSEGELQSRKEIHEQIYAKVKEYFSAKEI